ncbi:SpoIIE family protein phosphatase [Actinoplanes sp. NPDC051346]|uniref:SpoIIE family protein phosphatase n=1 Tax=Actinoplanes sp. NPDC051346 TaxID=3155048 RepID=UPI00341A6A34
MSPATVLVVDDSATKRYLLVSWLTRAGFTVVEAETGESALSLLSEAEVDLVVLDVKLPDLSGFDVCERIKTDPGYGVLPVIHVSAHAVDVVDRTQGLNRGADAYLVEPIEPDELIATAQAVLRYYRARQRAESLADRMIKLAETTLAINSASTLVGLLQAAADGASEIFGGPAVVVAETADGDGLAAVAGGPTEVRPWTVEHHETSVGSTVRTEQAEAWNLADWPQREAVAVASAKLRADRTPVYVAVPASSQTPGFPVLRQLSQAVAAAVEAQRSYDEEHRIAVTLQRSLLQSRLPDVPGLELAVRYEPAGAQTEVGGDFYELTMLDGRLLVGIGDVAGHSLHAATVMAELRHAVRAYAVEGHPPGMVLELVNRFMRTVLPAESATLCLFTLEPDTGRIRLASAGHLPPLLHIEGTGASFLTPRGPLLGINAPRPEDLEFVLPRGGTLVLYTDGLIERRDSDIDVGFAALAKCASQVESSLDAFCQRLLVQLAGAGEQADDIAVVALRRS